MAVKTGTEAVLLHRCYDEAKALEETPGVLAGIDPHLSEIGQLA